MLAGHGKRMTIGELTEIMTEAWEALQDMRIISQDGDDMASVRMEVFYGWYNRLEKLYDIMKDIEIS